MRSRINFSKTLSLVLVLAGCGSTQTGDADDTIDLIVNGDYVVTMDENLTRAVRHSFVKLWKKGLVYRGWRMVNWDTKLQSAIGDDEIEEKEAQGSL